MCGAVRFSRALVEGLLTQDMVDDYDPALMFTIPRLAIVSGLLFYPYMSPLSLDQNATNMSDMFRPFRVSVWILVILIYNDYNRILSVFLCTAAVVVNENPRASADPIQRGAFDPREDAMFVRRSKIRR